MKRLLSAAALALLSSCTNEIVGLTCKTGEQCGTGYWCDDGVCVACEPLGAACTGPSDAAAAGPDGSIVLGPDTGVEIPPDASAARPDAGFDAGPSLDAGPRPDGSVVVPLDAGEAPGDAGPTAKACQFGSQVGVGACRAGTQYLVDGVWGPCLGEVFPSAEVCDGVDNDCNGTPDDGIKVPCGVGKCQVAEEACTATGFAKCSALTPSVKESSCDGVDDNCNGLIDEDGVCACAYVDKSSTANTHDGLTPTSPALTINDGIAAAKLKGWKQVCVAAGSLCVAAATSADYSESVLMSNGIQVLGGFQSGASWVRSPETCRTGISAPLTAETAVRFDSSVTAPTQIAGFVIRAINAPSAIEVEGSTGAVISHNLVMGGSAAVSRGIDVSSGTPRIEFNAIDGGSGTTSSTGIYASAAAPVIRLNCGSSTSLSAQPCGLNADDPSTVLSILGRSAAAVGTTVWSIGIDLEGCPNAVVSQNAVGAGGLATNAAALKVNGKSAGVLVTQNTLRAVAGANAASFPLADYTGVLVSGCASAEESPRIVGNQIAASVSSATRAAGVHSLGLCAPRIEANPSIVGNEKACATCTSVGVWCGVDGGGIASPCVVARNALVKGAQSDGASMGTSTLAAYGIECGLGACKAIVGNTKVTAGEAKTTIGVKLQGGGTLLDANLIDAGCAASGGAGTGLRAEDAVARVTNNVIRGVRDECAGTWASTAVSVVAEDPNGKGREIDVHSNNLLGSSGAGACTSRTVAFEAAGALSRGLLRNNIVGIGGCATSAGVVEPGATKVRVFENNDLFGGSHLYLRGGLYFTVIDDVNGKVGQANISADPAWGDLTSFHLGLGSKCIDAGSTEQVPPKDLWGTDRTGAPEIGAVTYP